MKNLKKTSWVSYVLSVLIFASLTTCENPIPDVVPGPDQGNISIEIGLEMRVQTASARLQEVNTDDFQVTLLNASDEVYLYFERYADIPSGIAVEPGLYTVMVESPNDMLPGFENPKYTGTSGPVEVAPAETKAVTVTAALANCMVSVVYSQYLTDNCTDYYTVVSNSSGSLTFTAGESRPGYFDLEPLHLEAHLTCSAAGGIPEERIITGAIPVPAAKTHYTVQIDLAREQGTATVAILVDEAVVEEMLDITGAGVVPGPVFPGDLLITEIMYDPSAVSDTEGEWFEIYNNSVEVIDIYQLVLKKDTEVRHIVSEHIELGPQQYLVLGRHLNATTAVDYIYGSDLALTNTGDNLVLANFGNDGSDGQEICSVDYGEPGFPDGTGASLNLDPGSFDPLQAQLGSSWCLSTLTYETGDLGTPGMDNSLCTE